jgi:hypothetical protein
MCVAWGEKRQQRQNQERDTKQGNERRGMHG